MFNKLGQVFSVAATIAALGTGCVTEDPGIDPDLTMVSLAPSADTAPLSSDELFGPVVETTGGSCSDNETGAQVGTVCRRPWSAGSVYSSTQWGNSCIVEFKCWEDPAPVIGYSDCPTGRGIGSSIDAQCSAWSKRTPIQKQTFPLPAGESCSGSLVFWPDWLVQKAGAFCAAQPGTTIEGTGTCCTLKPGQPTACEGTNGDLRCPVTSVTSVANG